MRATAFALFFLAGCSTMTPGPTAISGEWGGPHVRLVLGGGLGALEYDCASGTIDSPIIPDPAGRFAITGTHRPGQGGPVRVGQIFTSYPARYTGTVDRDEMTLTIVVDDDTVIGPYRLRHGEPPQLTRCL
jgi:hypothetical protein